MRKRTVCTRRTRRRALLFFAAAAACFFLWDLRVRPAAEELAEQYAGRAALSAMSAGVESCLAGSGESLLRIETGPDGEVRFLETDMAAVNRIKLEVTEQVLQSLEGLSSAKAGVPLGTLFGSQLLAGLGPDFTCRFRPAGSLSIRLESRFEDAGVNQTRCQLMLCLETDVTALLAGSRVEVSVPTEYLLTEAVVVGEVPENYTRVLTGDEEIVSDINDYRAE